MNMTPKEKIDFIRSNPFMTGYVQAMLWSSTTDEENFDHVTLEDIPVLTLDRIFVDCQTFMESAGDKITMDMERAGHDFWLTRCGHGCGFWDGDWEVDGDALTELSKEYGNLDLYFGDDGLVYFM